MANNDDYKPLSFPGSVGGGPGPVEVVALTVAASGSATASGPVTAVANRAAYYAASDANKQRHARFSDVVRHRSQYGMPVKVESTSSTVITLHFEIRDMFEDSSLGKPGWFTAAAARKTAYELAQAYVASNAYEVDSISVTIDGNAQNA